MSGIIAEAGKEVVIATVERFAPDLAKLLGAALGVSTGAGAYKYLAPITAGSGFDRSKKSARKAGIGAGRHIASGNIYRAGGHLSAQQVSQNASYTYRRNKKHRTVQHSGSYHYHAKNCYCAKCCTFKHR